MNNLKHAGGWSYGLITFASCVTCTTIGHYAELWSSGYFLSLMFAAFGGLSILFTQSD